MQSHIKTNHNMETQINSMLNAILANQVITTYCQPKKHKLINLSEHCSDPLNTYLAMLIIPITDPETEDFFNETDSISHLLSDLSFNAIDCTAEFNFNYTNNEAFITININQ